jgi:hypothetical protein
MSKATAPQSSSSRVKPIRPLYREAQDLGTTIGKLVGTDQASTDTERPVAISSRSISSESLIGPFVVVLSLSSVIEEEWSGQELSIEVPTYEAATGIFQVLSAQLLRTATQGRSTGGSRHE